MARSACLRQLLGTGVANAALGFVRARHNRPSLRVDVTANFPSIFALHLDKFFALGLVPFELCHTNRSQTLRHRRGCGLLRHRPRPTVGHPSAEVETEVHGYKRATDTTP